MGALVYVNAILFALMVFPVHVYNYIYINTGQKYASLNCGAYCFNFFNANTVENKPAEMQINGKNKNLSPKDLNLNYYKIFNKICMYKIIQLCDVGIENQNNAYIALAQNSLTTALYKFIQTNGNYCKLRNYIIINEEHANIRYYSKAVTIINLFVIFNIILTIIGGKINEYKKQKKQG